MSSDTTFIIRPGTTMPPQTDIQPAYGVPVVQPKYGVVISTEPQVQPAYGVPIVQPKYGVQIGTDIDITYAQLEENIKSLDESIKALSTSWEAGVKNDIMTIENSWAGADCEAYTKKLKNMDGKVQNTIAALTLLKQTYEQARDMVKESQSKTVNSIEGIE